MVAIDGEAPIPRALSRPTHGSSRLFTRVATSLLAAFTSLTSVRAEDPPETGTACVVPAFLEVEDATSLAGSTDVNRNENVIFTVNDLMPGTYTFWCSIVAPGGTTHASFGMVGELTITP